MIWLLALFLLIAALVFLCLYYFKALKDSQKNQVKTKQEVLQLKQENEVLNKNLELAKIPQETSSILSHLPIGLLVVNAQSEIVYVNSQTEMILGITFSEVKNQKISQILEMHDTNARQINLEELTAISAGKNFKIEFKTPDKKLWFNVKLVKFGSDADKIYLLLLSSIDEFSEELTRMQSFYSQAAHDLKTPITIIRSVVELLLEKGNQIEAEKQNEMISDIKNQTDLLQNLVEDILNIARLEQGKIHPNFASIKINDLVQTSFSKLGPLIKSKGLGFDFDSAISSSIKVKADQHLLQTVFDNLLSNAVKYTFSGSISINIEQENTTIKVNFVDTGVGIDREHQNLLFKLYQQVGESRKLGSDKSTGLGLFIARQMARLMNGDVILTESIPGKGSIFTVILPVG